MNPTHLTHLKEKIAIGEKLTPAEVVFVLDCINAMTPHINFVHSPNNTLDYIGSLWAFISTDETGEGVCAMPIGNMTVPMIAADERRLTSLRPFASILASAFRKPIRLVRFMDRENLELFKSDEGGDGDSVRRGGDQAGEGGERNRA